MEWGRTGDAGAEGRRSSFLHRDPFGFLHWHCGKDKRRADGAGARDVCAKKSRAWLEA